ncbi:hypothetical protein M0812_13475 [Anaeramoeba flamelloides]|uniref:Uncharacterized protein n=1 Tax=Anaeramoeba flamelloides TaxID=1746091 RepID=A0AAV7ZIE2_9EUKA|nr:hypothetical protein M0812_13475 [Anaeramoeba flamelloides]
MVQIKNLATTNTVVSSIIAVGYFLIFFSYIYLQSKFIKERYKIKEHTKMGRWIFCGCFFMLSMIFVVYQLIHFAATNAPNGTDFYPISIAFIIIASSYFLVLTYGIQINLVTIKDFSENNRKRLLLKFILKSVLVLNFFPPVVGLICNFLHHKNFSQLDPEMEENSKYVWYSNYWVTMWVFNLVVMLYYSTLGFLSSRKLIKTVPSTFLKMISRKDLIGLIDILKIMFAHLLISSIVLIIFFVLTIALENTLIRFIFYKLYPLLIMGVMIELYFVGKRLLILIKNTKKMEEIRNDDASSDI